MGYTNSPLVNYTRLSPNYTDRAGTQIKKITIHHMAGNCSVETCGAIFSRPDRKASANYGIGTDGRVGLYVEEKNRAWTSSNKDNDMQAVTMEVANDGGAPNWHVSDVALAKTIDLCVDICQRNGIEKLNYTGDATGNLTMHCYFHPTACPGPYMKSKFQYIADTVNARLASAKVVIKENEKPATAGNGYKVYSKEEFIEKIAAAVNKWRDQFGIKVSSPIIAQAVLESGYGTSTKAQHHNYFGLKYRPNRCPSSNGTFIDGSAEQKSNGQYVSIVDQWFEFPSLELGVKGYFEFTNISAYKNLKGVTDPKTYLVNIRADGYATSLKYVDNLMNVIAANNLTRFDNGSTPVASKPVEKPAEKPVEKPVEEKPIEKPASKPAGGGIPSSVPTTAYSGETVTENGNTYHIVAKGNTLNEIATKYGTTTKDILKLNPSITNPNLIKPGQKILVKMGQQKEYHIVSKGDTLKKIADKYKIPLVEILKLNPDITNPNLIKPNQSIRLK